MAPDGRSAAAAFLTAAAFAAARHCAVPPPAALRQDGSLRPAPPFRSATVAKGKRQP